MGTIRRLQSSEAALLSQLEEERSEDEEVLALKEALRQAEDAAVAARADAETFKAARENAENELEAAKKGDAEVLDAARVMAEKAKEEADDLRKK